MGGSGASNPLNPPGKHGRVRVSRVFEPERVHRTLLDIALVTFGETVVPTRDKRQDTPVAYSMRRVCSIE